MLQEVPSTPLDEDSLSAYLAEHPLDDILTGNTDLQGGKDGTQTPSCLCETRGPCCLKRDKTISTLETQLKTAAELGQAILVRHQDYIATAENEKAERISTINTLKERINLANFDISKSTASNAQLVKQVSVVSESLFVSEAKVEQLTRTLQDQHSQLVKANNSAAKTESLESQISILESARETLQQECQMAVREKRLAEARWRKTERKLEKLTVQYERLEEEAVDGIDPSVQGKSSSPNEPATPMQDFIKTLLQENASLEATAFDLREQLAASKEELKDLRNQLKQVSRTGYAETDSQREVHHHHHFHVLPPGFQPRQPPHSKQRSKQIQAPNQDMRSPHEETPSPQYPPHRRRYSLPEAREDDSDTCAGDDDTSGGFYYDNYPYVMDKNTVRKFISHESGLRGLAQNEISMIDPVMYSHYPGSPNVVIEEDEELGVVYSPMPKLQRSTSHDSIFSALDVNQTATPIGPPSLSEPYLSIPEITPSHRPSLYNKMSSSKSEVVNVSAEFTFSATPQTNKVGSKMLLTAAVANNARRRTSLKSYASSAGDPSTPPRSTASSVTSTSPTPTPPLNKKWSTFFSKLTGSSTSDSPSPPPPTHKTLASSQKPAILKPTSALCTPSPRIAVSTPMVPGSVLPSRPLSSTFQGSPYMNSFSGGSVGARTVVPTTSIGSINKSAEFLVPQLRQSVSASSLKSAYEAFFTPSPSTASTVAITPSYYGGPSGLLDERALAEALNDPL